MQRILVAATLFGAACAAAPQVVREGEGWRELQEGSGTRIEITTGDQALLAKLATTHEDGRVRAEAAARVTDQVALGRIARSEKDPAVRKMIVERLIDPDVLLEVARSDGDSGVRAIAAARAKNLIKIGPQHADYKSWQAARPGAWVVLSADVKESAAKVPFQITRKCLGAVGDKIVLEQRVTPEGDRLADRVRSMLSHLNPGSGRPRQDEGQDSVEIGGRRLQCRWVRLTQQRDDTIVRIRCWFQDEIPGGVARMDIEEAPEGAPLRTMIALASSWQR